MNKLVWIIGALVLIIILGSGGVFAYTKGYRVKITKPESVPTTSETIADTSEETSTAKEVKDVHCLQNPTKGTQIIIDNLTDYQIVKSPLTITGSANAFESQFSYRLKDCRGPIITEGIITAEGEMGTMPPFSQTITFTPSRNPLDATLEVYEISAQDGSEINLFQVPLRLTQ